MKRRTRRYRRYDRSEIRPLAIITGTPRDARVRRVFGQSSVSMQIRNTGSMDATARRATEGKSSGKKR